MDESVAAVAPPLRAPEPAPAALEPMAKRIMRWVDVALIFAIFIVLELAIAPGAAHAVYNLANRIGPGMERYPLPALIQIGAQEGLILLVIFCFVLLRGLSFADLGFRKTSFFWILAGMAALIVALPIRLCLGVAAHFAIGGTLETIAGAADENAFPLIDSPALAGLPAVLMVGVVAPLVEELIFRAILYVKLRQRLGVMWATIISSLIFGVIHSSVAMGVSAAVMGVVLAWLYEKSRSLWLPLLLHIVNNTALFLFLVFVVGIQEIAGFPGF